MPEWWPMLLGWPALLASIFLSVAGIAYRKPTWLAVAAVIVVPITFYLAASPIPGWPASVMPLALAGAAIAVRGRHIKSAWFLLSPLAGLSSWLAVAVMSQ